MEIRKALENTRQTGGAVVRRSVIFKSLLMNFICMIVERSECGSAIQPAIHYGLLYGEKVTPKSKAHTLVRGNNLLNRIIVF